MAEAQQQQEETVEVVREGGRWLHGKPGGDDVDAWFKSQQLHEGMTHDPYLSGIVLIPQTDKVKVTRRKRNGDPYEVELEQAAYTPYVKVETRVAYFWDYVRALNEAAGEARFVGVIEPVEQKRIADPNDPFRNDMLPEGFSSYAVRIQRGEGQVTRYVTATYRVAIFEQQAYAERVKGNAVRPLLAGEGTKQVPAVQRNGYADDSSLMKAQTGAIGRALGFAGILVVGTGVATAEDVQEAQGGGGGATPEAAITTPPIVNREGEPVEPGIEAAVPVEQPAQTPQEAPQEPQTPDGVPAPPQTDEERREHAKALQEEMMRDHPAAWKRYVAWYTEERQFGPLADLSGPALKGAVTKLERDLDAARQNPEPPPEPPATEPPAEGG